MESITCFQYRLRNLAMEGDIFGASRAVSAGWALVVTAVLQFVRIMRSIQIRLS